VSSCDERSIIFYFKLTMSTRMTKLTSLRAGRKAADENEAVSGSAEAETETKLSSTSSDNKGQADQGSGTVKPPAAWTTSSQRVATSTAASGPSERWMGSGTAHNADATGKGNANFFKACLYSFYSSSLLQRKHSILEVLV
jgi:hypothetical protein